MSGRRARQRRRDKGRAYVLRWMRAYVKVLRGILKRVGIAKEKPAPCHSCAFNPGTDEWAGFDSTMYGLLKSVMSGTPFVCHEHLPRNERGEWFHDPATPTVPCAGYEAIRHDPATARAHFDAFKAIGRPSPPSPGILPRGGKAAKE